MNVLDITSFINYVNSNRTGILFIILPRGPYYDPDYDFNEDGVVNVLDLNMMVDFVNYNSTGRLFVVNCNTCSC